MRAHLVVEVDPRADDPFSDRHSRSMKMLSRKRPRPSIENATPAPRTRSANASLVNWDPWSVFRISGARQPSALSRASTQNDASIVFDSRHASTCRVAQSITATR